MTKLHLLEVIVAAAEALPHEQLVGWKTNTSPSYKSLKGHVQLEKVEQETKLRTGAAEERIWHKNLNINIYLFRTYALP